MCTVLLLHFTTSFPMVLYGHRLYLFETRGKPAAVFGSSWCLGITSVAITCFNTANMTNAYLDFQYNLLSVQCGNTLIQLVVVPYVPV